MADPGQARRLLEVCAELKAIFGDEKKFLVQGLKKEWLARQQAAMGELQGLMGHWDSKGFSAAEEPLREEVLKTLMALNAEAAGMSKALGTRVRLAEIAAPRKTGKPKNPVFYGASGAARPGNRAHRLDKTQ